MKPVHVEFIGLPGSGKSTISQLVLEELKAKNLRVLDRQSQQERVADQYRGMSKKERLSSFVNFCEQNNDLVFELSRLTASLRPIHRAGLRRSFIFLKQCQNAELFQQSKTNCDVLIHDQDIIQELWSVIYLRDTHRENLRPVFSAMQNWLPELTVFIDLDGSVALERMAGRAKALNRFTGEIDSMENLDAKTLDKSNATTRFLGELSEEFGSTLLTIDGLEIAEKSVPKVVEKIEQLVLFDT